MKHIETKLNNQEHKIYTLVVGTQELELLHALLHKAKVSTPRVIETIPTLGRLRQMWKTTGEALGKLQAKKIKE